MLCFWFDLYTLGKFWQFSDLSLDFLLIYMCFKWKVNGGNFMHQDTFSFSIINCMKRKWFSQLELAHYSLLMKRKPPLVVHKLSKWFAKAKLCFLPSILCSSSSLSSFFFFAGFLWENRLILCTLLKTVIRSRSNGWGPLLIWLLNINQHVVLSMIGKSGMM